MMPSHVCFLTPIVMIFVVFFEIFSCFMGGLNDMIRSIVLLEMHCKNNGLWTNTQVKEMMVPSGLCPLVLAAVAVACGRGC